MDTANRESSAAKEKDLFVGFDVGSSAVHCVVLNKDREIVFSPEPIIHFANPIGAVQEAWREITLRFPIERIGNTAFTGSGAESFPEVMKGVTYVFDSVAIPKGVEVAVPQAQYIFHIGAKDPYFFNVKPSYTRSAQIETNSALVNTGNGPGNKEKIVVSEFEISCYLANYLEI